MDPTRRVWLTVAVLLLVFGQYHSRSVLPYVIKIGAILEIGEEKLETIINRTVEQINEERKIMPRSRLSVIVHFVNTRDSSSAAKLACKLLENQIWAILSSNSEAISWYARSLANTLNIPHLAVNWEFKSRYLNNINQKSTEEPNLKFKEQYLLNPQSVHYGSSGYYTHPNVDYSNPYGPIDMLEEQTFTFNYFPDSTHLSEAYESLISYRNWKSLTLIYDTDERLIQMKDIFRLTNVVKKQAIKLNILKFEEDSKNRGISKRQDPFSYQSKPSDEKNGINYTYRKMMKKIKSSEHNYVLNIDMNKAFGILQEAKLMNRISEYDNFLFATLDMHLYNLTEFQMMRSLPNMTSFSLISPEGQEIDLGDVNQYRKMKHGVMAYKHDMSYKLTTVEALVNDALIHFARSLDDLDRAQPELIERQVYNVSCNRNTKWSLGQHIVNYMRKTIIVGKTGLLVFDSRGYRVNFTLDVLQLKKDGLENIEKWTKLGGMQSANNFNFNHSYHQILETMKQKTFKVSIPPGVVKPYIFPKENAHEFTGNNRFTGYCVDLLEEIARVFREDFQSDFQYELRPVADGQYGSPNAEGEWNGMLGELMRSQADLAIADLTATYMRETAVDFTMPFMNLGIAILFKSASEPDPELFSFLKPFSEEVWLYLASAFLGISLLLWILSRISPYEWVSPHSCDPEPLELENQFSIGNSLWFTIGSLMQQGSDLAPRALSTRILASVWWFFTLIMISSYTANLAASLTLSRMAPAISNVEDLAKQTTIQYGCKGTGSTHAFFKDSNHTTYQRMYNTMESNREVYINDINDAIERIRKGGYAYLAESSTIEYLIQRHCDLIQVGFWLDNKGYGIATPNDSPYRTPISNAIVVLQDKGVLYALKKRWWEEKGKCKIVSNAKAAVANDLKIENVGGVFVVLVAGVVLGCLLGALEFIWKSLKIARDERESIGKLIWLEIIRICTGGGSSRPVFASQSSSNNINSASNGTDDRPLMKSGSYNSININYNNSPDFGQYRHPISNGTNNSIGTNLHTESTMPLISPSSAPDKSMAQFNNFGASSPNSFKSQPFTMY